MKVSILIPTYNRGYVIRKALESALNQTYRDFEIIVVDDGSTDNTSEIVESVASERIRYIRHGENRGYSAACNTAIASVRGEVAGFLDSDDIWLPAYLERQIGFLSEHAEASVVFCDTELLSEDEIKPSLVGLMRCFPQLLGSKEGKNEYLFSLREMYICLLEEVPVKPNATLIRREVLDDVGGFNEAWPSGTDWDLFLRISRKYRFGFVNHPLVRQRVSADSTYKNVEAKDKEFLIDVLQRERGNIERDLEALAAVKRGIESRCNDLAHILLYSGNRFRAFSVYLRGAILGGRPSMIVKAMSSLIPLGLRDYLRHAATKATQHRNGAEEL